MKENLFNRSFVLILAANFMLYMGFYLLLPVLPFFLSESFASDKATIGSALSCYTIAALMVRPFSGYLLDSFSRKPLYLMAFAAFTVLSASYVVAWCLVAFICLRMLHGFAFGMVTVGGNTIVIDVMPSSRRGEGLGYYGMANNIAMAIGPMIGLFIHDHFPFTVLFGISSLMGIVGLTAASLVKVKARPLPSPTPAPQAGLDRFILLKGLPAGVSLMLLSIPYGLTTTYIAMYGNEIGITVSSGIFFSFMAIGIASSRIFSGKLVDRGYTTEVIRFSIIIAAIAFASIGASALTATISTTLATVEFLASALLMGIGFGIMFPAYNTLFVNLAPNSQRATAVSTYLTSWDAGIGLGLLVGGLVAQMVGFSAAYFIGAILAMVSYVFFRFYVGPHYLRHRISKDK